MKQIQLLAVFLLPMLFIQSGCVTPERLDDGVYRGDAFLYNADTVITTAYDMFHTFVLWEYENRSTLSQRPEIKHTADKIRTHSKRWISSAITLRDAYAANPNEENRKDLESVLKVIRTAMLESLKYINE
jgi:hypothetical protein